MKKTLIGAGAILLVGLFIFGGDLWSYIRTGANNVKEGAEALVPTEFQLKRAKDKLTNEIKPKITELKEAVAKAEYDVEKAEASKKETVALLQKKRSEMLARHNQLKSAPEQQTFQIKNASFTRKQLDEDLHARLDKVKSLDGKLAAQQKTVDAKTKAHNAQKARLAKYQKVEEQLTAMIEQLEARLEAVKAQEDVADNVDNDDSALKDLEALIGKIDEDVTVRDKVVEAAGADSVTEIPVDDDHKSAVDEVSAYLGTSDTEPVAKTDGKTPAGEIPVE